LAKRQFVEADAALGRCLELLPPNEAKYRGNLESLQERCRRLDRLDKRLPEFVEGTDKPATHECLDAAELCLVRGYFATAARLYADSLSATPSIGDDLSAGHRFNAACAAASAAAGQGDEAIKLSDAERDRFRSRAREWLQLDLADWTTKVETGTAADRIHAEKALTQWREAPELKALREADALDRLSADEERAWVELWRDVAAVLNRAQVAM
jgi:hypothetical protein